MKNKKLDYSKLNEVIVHTQEELDNIPLDYEGKIIIDDTNDVWLQLNNKYNKWVIARNSARVYARNSAMVDAYDSAMVYARNSAMVYAYGNVQVLNNLDDYKTDTITLKGNSRIVYLPKCIEYFMNYHRLKHTKTKAIFYKAVHKIGDKYVRDWDKNFIYTIGKTISQACNQDVEEDCGEGIHISTLPFALDFGSSWNDIAILECETKIEDIVFPNETTGKVRTSKVKVLREVPLNECGVRGEMLAREIEFRKNNN